MINKKYIDENYLYNLNWTFSNPRQDELTAKDENYIYHIYRSQSSCTVENKISFFKKQTTNRIYDYFLLQIIKINDNNAQVVFYINQEFYYEIKNKFNEELKNFLNIDSIIKKG